MQCGGLWDARGRLVQKEKEENWSVLMKMSEAISCAYLDCPMCQPRRKGRTFWTLPPPGLICCCQGSMETTCITELGRTCLGRYG